MKITQNKKTKSLQKSELRLRDCFKKYALVYLIAFIAMSLSMSSVLVGFASIIGIASSEVATKTAINVPIDTVLSE